MFKEIQPKAPRGKSRTCSDARVKEETHDPRARARANHTSPTKSESEDGMTRARAENVQHGRRDQDPRTETRETGAKCSCESIEYR